MNEPKDDLLAAFENPDMAVSEMPEAVPNTVPQAPVAPVAPEPVANPNVAPVAPQGVPTQAPVAPTPAPAPAPEPVAPVAPAPAAPVEENQNTMPNVSEEPAVAVAQTVKDDEPKEEGSVKKNLAFIIVICVVIAVFILFLPKIMSLLNGGSY